ncbi:MAG: hypothetical protein R3C68_14945 [Myxococcota bacterium]
MAYLSEDKIASIVERVVDRLRAGDTPSPGRLPVAAVNPPFGCAPTRAAAPRVIQPTARLGGSQVGRGVFTSIDDAVSSASVVCAIAGPRY